MNNQLITSNSKARRRGRTRRGVMSFELLLVIPILLIVIVGGIEVSQLLMANQALQAASAAGAREASMPGSTEADVREAVRRSVIGWRFEPEMMDSDIDIAAIDMSGSVIALGSAMPGDVVKVSIEIDATAAVPDFLLSWGLSIASKKMNAASIFRRE